MNKCLFRTLPLLLILAASPAMVADETRPPDYSREALLVMFVDFYAPEKPDSLEWDVPIAGSRVRVRFLPLVLPLLSNGSRGDLMPPVSAFDLLNVSFPSTRAMVALDDRNVRKAIRQIERRRAREARYRE